MVEPSLARWTYSANISKDEGKHTDYVLKALNVNSIVMKSPTEALVRAKIEESRDQFSAGRSTPYASLDDAYEVEYALNKIEGEWRIKEMKVAE